MFSELLLDDPLFDAIEHLGFTDMTEVQQAAMPLALEGRDLIVNARTGSGKTLAYVVPMLQQILDNPQTVSQALILSPTRELCRQINKQCNLLAKFTDISSTIIIGGEDPRHQIKALQTFPDIIVATPGRLLEHVKRDVIDLDAINILIIDEADRMLDMGFIDDVITIATQCSDECQTLLFSASFNQKKFQELTEAVLYQAETIIVDSPRDSSENIHQQKLLADDSAHKIKLCAHLIAAGEHSKTIIFANKKDTVNSIGAGLQSNGIDSVIIHSDVDQDMRNQLLRKFRLGAIKVLVATDVASRGLDIPDLDLIINFDVPKNGDDYLHRIGRTGRMHETGDAITLVNATDWNRMISIENFLGIESTEISIDSLPARYTGPQQRKSSGKAYGVKRKKVKKLKKKAGKKTKTRLRDRKNIGKRRKPSEKKDDMIVDKKA